MGNLVTFAFQNNEGKYFAPIASEEPTYIVVNGVIQANGNQIISGIKGAFALIKLKLPVANAGTQRELFALNTEAINSSN